jgi:hypothetical protein
MKEKKDNAILSLTIEFSIAVISFVEELEAKRKFVIANQLLKSGQTFMSTKNNLKTTIN